MKKIGKRMIPAVLAFSLAASVPAYAEEFVPGPGNPYDEATTARLKDNVLEYDEIEMLIDTYNQTLKNLKESYSDLKDSYKTTDKLKEKMYDMSGTIADGANQLSGAASMLEATLGYPGMAAPGAYAEALYQSEMLSMVAEQTILQADSITSMTPDMLKVKMVDSTRALLVSGAQNAMIGYEQLLLSRESLADTIGLLEEVYKSTQTQAEVGLATANDVLTAKQNLESVQANMITIDSNEIKIRQSLCTLLGWEYDGTPEIQKVPAADMSRIDRMNPETDKEAAIANNFTLKYNVLDYAEKTDGSVEQMNLERTIEEQKATISSSLVNLYNDVLQKRNEYQTAVAAFELEKTKMDTAERKMQVGTIGRLEYLQQKNAYVTKEIAVKNADLALFQAMETYDWAVKGNLNIS